MTRRWYFIVLCLALPGCLEDPGTESDGRAPEGPEGRGSQEIARPEHEAPRALRAPGVDLTIADAPFDVEITPERVAADREAESLAMAERSSAEASIAALKPSTTLAVIAVPKGAGHVDGERYLQDFEVVEPVSGRAPQTLTLTQRAGNNGPIGCAGLSPKEGTRYLLFVHESSAAPGTFELAHDPRTDTHGWLVERAPRTFAFDRGTETTLEIVADRLSGGAR